MPFTLEPLFPGMLFDAASRFAEDHAAAPAPQGDPVRELGWTATLVPEDDGGVGGTLADLASVVEGLATHGVQLPLVETCAIVPLLLRAAAPEVAGRWLRAVAEGEACIAPLTAVADTPDACPVQARRIDIGYALRGGVHGVDATLPASHHLVPARLGDEAVLFLVDGARLGAPAATYRTMEGRRGADFMLADLALPESACIARGAALSDALAAATDAALLLTLADVVAALGALIRQTIAHLQERRQFGVALASFQVLRHRLADLYVRYLCARGLVTHCFHAHEQQAPDLRRTLRLAKLSVARTARSGAEAAIQMHGGMGLSEEVLATRLAQRLIASEFRHGDRLHHAALLRAEAPAGAGTTFQPPLSELAR